MPQLADLLSGADAPSSARAVEGFSACGLPCRMVLRPVARAAVKQNWMQAKKNSP